MWKSKNVPVLDYMWVFARKLDKILQKSKEIKMSCYILAPPFLLLEVLEKNQDVSQYPMKW